MAGVKWVAPSWLACVLSACGGAEAFACMQDAECVLGGDPGVCVDGRCAYPDPTCPSGYRHPASLGGMCAPGVGPGGTDSDASTGTASTSASSPTGATGDGSETSGSTQSVASTSDADTGVTSSGPTSTTMATSDASTTTTGGPPSDCGEQSCSKCAMCVREPGGDCFAQTQVCASIDGCPAAVSCMIACSVDDDCSQDCCENLDNEGITALLQLHACSAQTCVPACDLFEDPPCG